MAEDGSSASTSHDWRLDWLRAIAALLVMLGHARGAFFVKWSDLQPLSQTPINFVLFLVTRLGREAVVIFFVLSGYLVGGTALGRFHRGTFRFGAYLVARVARLYTVLVPALALTLVADYMRQPEAFVFSWSALVGNLFFLQGLVVPTFGSNAPLWSLAYEWWFYVIFGTIVQVGMYFQGSRFATAAIVASAALLSILSFLAWPGMFSMFPLWIMGVLVSRIRGPQPIWRRSVLACIVSLGLAMAADTAHETVIADYVVALFTALLIYALRTARNSGRGWQRKAELLAGFSYTLYAIHYPMLGLAISLFFPERSPVAGPLDWLRWAVLVALILFFCYGVSILTERHTPNVRAFLNRARFGNLDVTPAAPFERRKVPAPSDDRRASKGMAVAPNAISEHQSDTPASNR